MLRLALAECRADNRKVIIFLGGDTEGEETPTQDASSFLPRELEALGYGPEQYEVVTGDDRTSQKKIARFGADPAKWILISINMVSEGTDIPEISAAIFLTSITAKQTTVQRIGRPLRLMGEADKHKTALIYMFRDPHNVEIAQEIEAEMHAFEIRLPGRGRGESTGGGGSGERRARPEAIGIGDGKVLSVFFGGKEWPAAIFEAARRFLREHNLPHTMFHTALELLVREGRHENH